jgi:hypothetical protein
MEGPLAELPRARTDAGAGPVVPALLEGVLLAEGTVEAAREGARAWYGDLVGPLLVPAASTAGVQEQLAPGDHGLRVVLVAEPAAGDPSGLLGLREARNLLLDDDRLELTDVHVPLPAGDAGALLAELDFTAPAWVEVRPAPGWEAALETLAADGAEHLGLRLPPDAAAPGADVERDAERVAERVAELVRRAVDLDLTLRVTGAGGGAATTVQLLAALCAVRAALNGAEPAAIAAVLAERRTAPLAAALRRMSDADAAVARAFLDGVVVPNVAQVADDLAALGLVERDA